MVLYRDAKNNKK